MAWARMAWRDGHVAWRDAHACRENPDDEAAMVALLRSREIDALVLDASFVRYQDSLNCDLFGVGDTFNSLSSALCCI